MISIITPVHASSAPYLPDAYGSLCKQTISDWEWILVPNAGGKVPEAIAADRRVRVVPAEDDDVEHNCIGRLKRFAAQQATGSILVELDADDMLVPEALAKIKQELRKPSIHMVYSNDAEFEHGTWRSEEYSSYWGWRSRDFIWEGHQLKEMIAWEPSAHMMRYIWWAPNHVRAWKTMSYWAVGGHDESIKTADDHDLCIRMYLAYGASGIKHIDECLYLYRVHGNNSCRTHNAEVQETMIKNYCKYRSQLVIRWAKDNGLRMVDLGGRFGAWPGFETVDLFDADINTDLNSDWPFADNSIGVIRASHIFEHLKSPIHTMNEAYRVLAPGGWLLIEVPSTDGRGAFQDPTHVSFWNENSFRYYTNSAYARYIRPAYTGRFQVSRIVTYDPFNDPTVPVVQADLIALKPPYDARPVGEVLI